MFSCHFSDPTLSSLGELDTKDKLWDNLCWNENTHRGYAVAVVCLSHVIEAVRVTSIVGDACNSDHLDHRT